MGKGTKERSTPGGVHRHEQERGTEGGRVFLRQEGSADQWIAPCQTDTSALVVLVRTRVAEAALIFTLFSPSSFPPFRSLCSVEHDAVLIGL